MKVICIGEVLWDVYGDQEHLGGAPFNFAAHLSKLGHDAAFISAVGNDIRGRRILDRMREMGLSSRYLRRDPEHETGMASVKVSSAGQPQFVIHRPAAYDFPQLADADFDDLLARPVDLIYFGTLHQTSSVAKVLTARLLEAAPGAHRFYDLNLRANSYQAALVSQLMARATIMKMNDEEVGTVSRLFGYPETSLEAFCRDYAKKFGWQAVCITRGSKGCSLLMGDHFVEAPGYAITVADTVGAGDAFAAAFVHGYGAGWSAAKIGNFANRVGALIASRRGAIPQWCVEEVESFPTQPQHQETA